MNELEKQQKELVKLLKERKKKEKKLNKEWQKRMESKYTHKALRAAKRSMLEDAYTIDSLEYRKIAQELKEHIEKNKSE